MVMENHPTLKLDIQRLKIGRCFFLPSQVNIRYTPEGLTWNIIMEVWFRSFSFPNGWFVDSMLIFQGVKWMSQKPECNKKRRICLWTSNHLQIMFLCFFFGGRHENLMSETAKRPGVWLCKKMLLGSFGGISLKPANDSLGVGEHPKIGFSNCWGKSWRPPQHWKKWFNKCKNFPSIITSSDFVLKGPVTYPIYLVPKKIPAASLSFGVGWADLFPIRNWKKVPGVSGKQKVQCHVLLSECRSCLKIMELKHCSFGQKILRCNQGFAPPPLESPSRITEYPTSHHRFVAAILRSFRIARGSHTHSLKYRIFNPTDK